ncbi:DUF459 domain-containing protein [Corticibacterium sp. UT-5YL-CI-8]|nr:DUF459 domain-containing protein [Tianweitania sp. UT-5YL-CI-8]
MRAAKLILLSALLVPGAILSTSISATAQEGVLRRGFFRDLFAPAPPQEPERRYSRPPIIVQPGIRPAPVRRSKAVATPRKPPEPEVVVAEKKEDARVILVVGDFLGGGLAEGLSTVFAENAGIRVIDRSNGSSGLVRDDYFDWPGQLGKIIAEQKPSAVLVMLGSNDRQQLKVGSERAAPMSDAWDTEYTRRAAQLARIVTDSKVPALWVGMPSFKASKMTADMVALNDIYRTVASKSGIEFVDIWDGFTDQNGAFVTTGPDINGQPVRLRSDDGINMTRQGKRKMAFYAEKPLNKLLGLSSAGETPVAGLPGAAPGALNLPTDIDRTMPISLNDPELDGSTELLGAQVGPKQEPRTPSEKLQVLGIAPEPTPGRADDFRWVPQLRTTQSADEATTSAIKR